LSEISSPVVIVLASHNPVKMEATLNGFRRMFPAAECRLETVAVPSGVSDQPMSDAETLKGAANRAANAAAARPAADFWVGIEGGLVDHPAGEMEGFAWIVVRGRMLTDSGAYEGKARTGSFFLPGRVAQLVRTGLELGDADDVVFNRSNSKQENGAVGILTGNALDRTELYEQAVILALIPFKNPTLY
jgi:inosine/xanthosine triphosphatase